jgi:hypothetical protein
MTATTARADAQALPEPPTDTIASNAPPSPEAAKPVDEEMRLIVEKCFAEAKLQTYLDKRKAEKDKAAADAEKAEEDKELQASRAFTSAYHAWLAANAGLEDPDITDEEQPERWRAKSEAERRLFSTPATVGEHFWDKLTAFEQILGEEMTVGLRKESILLLAVGCIKQDIINLDLLEAAR